MDSKQNVVNRSHQNRIDVSKICRTCLTEKGEMRSIFQTDERLQQETTTTNKKILADMLMALTNLQISADDGLPTVVCVQCVLEVSRACTFKQLCEDSDKSLRQYLGKPLLNNKENMKETTKQDNQQSSSSSSNFSSSFFYENFNLDDSSSNDSDDSFVQNLQYSESSSPNMANDEKTIATKQLMVVNKLGKGKLTKKKFLAKISGKPGLLKQIKRNGHQCNVCKKQFINFKSFRKHLRTHIEDRPFKCKLCARGFTEENYLNNHMRTHIPEDQKPHECKVCKKRFIHATLLSKHLLKHTGEKPFVCKICNKGCYAENSLLKHMKIHEKKEGDPALLKHICDYCRSEFPDRATLATHIKQHTGDRPFLCITCGKTFPQRFNLDLHVRTHTGERPFTCEICHNGYVSKASLKIHLRTHTNERPFVCDFCGKAFRQSGDLTSHKRLHGTATPIECSVCNRRFTTVMKLKYHLRNHTGERPYVCSVCGRGFTVNTILIRHMRVHSGERPYVCVTCGKAFSQSSTLNTHMKIHAPSPKFNNAQDKVRMSQYECGASNVQVDHQITATSAGIVHNDQQRILQHQQQDNRLLTNDAQRIMADAVHLLGEEQHGSGNGSEHLMGHVQQQSETQPRLLLTNVHHDNGRMLHGNDGARHLAVVENTRLLTDKYLTNYAPYHHRGHL